ncbi:hypothetical protein DXG01_007179 [Tephrocybe rancida]|nr:hypothetical protein DXG01_007179 [Tephrocybe rancida]
MSDKEQAAAPAAVEEKKQVSSTEADLTKYKHQTAADIIHGVTKKLIELAVEGAKVLDLCVEGDKLIEAGTAGVYNKSVKGVKVSKGALDLCTLNADADLETRPRVPYEHLREQRHPQSEQVLAKDDVVKIQLGAHIDGFASISAETIVVGATAESPATGRRADVVKAAWHAAELAMRTIKVGNKNWNVTEAIGNISGAWGCKPVEGMLSCQQTQNVIDGKKRIILNPSEGQKRDFETATFVEGEVYGMDVLISSGDDGKARIEESRTTIYQRDSTITYQLKMKNSRAVFSEVQKKAGAFPFNIRSLEDEKRSRMGLQEAVQHNLVKPYEVVYTPAGTFVAGFHFTIVLLPGGPSLITHPPIWYKPELVKTEKELEDEELKATLARNLRESKKSKKKKTKTEGEEAKEE